MSDEIMFPAFALEKDLGTIEQVCSMEELLDFEYYDVADRNYLFWDGLGREISFELYKEARGLAFRPYLNANAALVGWSQMLAWAKRHGVPIDANQSWHLADLYAYVVGQCPAADTGRHPPTSLLEPFRSWLRKLSNRLRWRGE